MSIVDRRRVPHLRCGLCDQPIHPDEPTTYIDDERCHRECAIDRGDVLVAVCPRCGRDLDDESLGLEHCVACGEDLP